MNEFLAANKDLLDALTQLLLLVLPVMITWFIRNYVKGAKSEKDIAAIVQLANSAIDFVENLDSQGKLNLPPEVKKGAYKLQLGSQWLVGELDRAGIKMTNEQAQTWLASEFQKRVGDVRPVSDLARLAQAAVEQIVRLQQSGVLELPPGTDQLTYWAGLAADWILTNLPVSWTNISRDEALTWARAALLDRMTPQTPPNPPFPIIKTSPPAPLALPTVVPVVTLPLTMRLAQLADQAINFVTQAQAHASPAVQPVASTTDLALAWLLTEAVRQGLPVTADQLSEAVQTALRAHPRPA